MLQTDTRKKFSLVATGGTFDIIHSWHHDLLKTAFNMSEKAIIGLSSDEFAASREKTNHNKYDKKAENLQTIITKKFPEKSYIIAKLDSDFGPAVLENAR